MIWLIVTLVVFFTARKISQKLATPLANPLLISIAVIIPLLLMLDVPFELYYEGNKWLNNLLQPAVVALAYPLYQQLSQIRRNWHIILVACTLGSILSMLTATIIAVSLDADITLVSSLLGKSVTTPIAMEVASNLGGEPSIATIMVLIVGLFGAICAYPIYELLNIKHPIARGLTTGAISHALGTATCVEKDPKDAAFSSLALVICGIITSVIAPFAYSFAVWLYRF